MSISNSAETVRDLARLELDLETLRTLVVELPPVSTVRTSRLVLWRYLSFRISEDYHLGA